AEACLDLLPGLDDGLRRREILRLERRPAGRPAAAVEPAPLGAHYVDERVADGAVGAVDELGELLRRELGDDREQFRVRPVAVVEEAFEVLDGHRNSFGPAVSAAVYCQTRETCEGIRLFQSRRREESMLGYMRRSYPDSQPGFVYPGC